MKNRFNTAIKLLALAMAMGASAGASAQVAGSILIKAGINKITPHVESGDVTAPALPGTKADVGSDAEPLIVFTYMITDHFSVEGAIGLPYKSDLTGAGAIAGTGMLGSAEVLPPTAFLQYRFFDAKSTIRPYIGIGATYAYFQKETGSGQLTALVNTGGPGTTYRIDNKWAATPQVGVTVALNDRWFADLSVTKTYLKTRARYSTGQTQDLTLNPIGVAFGVGMRF